MGNSETNQQPSAWVKVLIVVLMLPALGFPYLISDLPADHTVRLLVWLYPAYVIAAGICAWMCARRRPEVTWILLALMLLTHAGVYYLATT